MQALWYSLCTRIGHQGLPPSLKAYAYTPKASKPHTAPHLSMRINLKGAVKPKTREQLRAKGSRALVRGCRLW